MATAGCRLGWVTCGKLAVRWNVGGLCVLREGLEKQIEWPRWKGLGVRVRGGRVKDRETLKSRV